MGRKKRRVQEKSRGKGTRRHTQSDFMRSAKFLGMWSKTEKKLEKKKKKRGEGRGGVCGFSISSFAREEGKRRREGQEGKEREGEGRTQE